MIEKNLFFIYSEEELHIHIYSIELVKLGK